MDETLKQLGELLLGSVPTVIFLVLTYLAYTVLVHKPLSRILAERHERTEGAVAKARADVAAAEARTAEYEQRLREARMAVFRTQEQKRQQATQLRASAVAEARSRAHALVEQQVGQRDPEQADAHRPVHMLAHEPSDQERSDGLDEDLDPEPEEGPAGV